MQKWLLTIIIAILPVITACSKTDTEVSVPEEETGKKTEIKFLQLNLWVECTKVEHAPEYLIERIPNPKIREIAIRNLKAIAAGQRDFRF